MDTSLIAALVAWLIIQAPWMPTNYSQCKYHADTLGNGYYNAVAALDLKSFKPGKYGGGEVKKPPKPEDSCNKALAVFNFQLYTL